MRGVKFEREIWPPVAAARPANRTLYRAMLSEEVCIVWCYRRLSKARFALGGSSFVGGYHAIGEQ